MAGITHEWNGTILTITSDSGTSSADLKGEKGDDGARGLTYVVSECVAEDSAKLGGIAASEYALKTDIVNQEGAVSREELEAALEGLATTESLNDYATKDYVAVELTEYATNAALNTALADCVSKEYVDNALSNLPTGDLDTHIADTNNPHSVSAEQIGAAAAADLEALAADVETHKNAENPHNITAAMIGAALDSHTHTAAEIGAALSNHTHTAAEVGAAPAIEDATYKGCYYRMVNGNQEWINPPLVLGVKYRLNERWNGGAVYAKMVDCGAMPNNTQKLVAYRDGSNTYFPLIMYGLTNHGNRIPRDYGAANHTKINADGVQIIIETNYDASAQSARVYIKYTQSY